MNPKVRISFFSLLIAFALAACQSPAAPAPTQAPVSTTIASAPDQTEQNIAIVRRFYEEFSKGNADVILEVHTPSLRMHYAGSTEEVPAQVLRDDLAAIKAANPDLRAEVHDIFGSGDIVVTELTWTATHTGDFFDLPASGKTVIHNGIVVRRLEDGKIVESWEMWDDLAFLQSIGYLPSWDEIVASQTAAEPTPDPAQAVSESPITSISDMVGIWQGQPGEPGDPPQSYWWFQPDGRYQIVFELHQFVDGFPVEAGTFSFDNEQLTLEATQGGCEGEEGKAVYTAVLKRSPDGKRSWLNLSVVSEPCSSRRNGARYDMPWVREKP
jgi:steroid delta-isomerase-like uncharacterized protein